MLRRTQRTQGHPLLIDANVEGSGTERAATLANAPRAAGAHAPPRGTGEALLRAEWELHTNCAGVLGRASPHCIAAMLAELKSPLWLELG